MLKLSKTKLSKTLAIAVFFVLLVLWNPVRFFDPLKSGFSYILFPFQKAAYSFSAGLGGLKDFLGSIGQLKQENESLLADKQFLLSQNAQLNDLKRENDDLRSQLGMLPRDKYELVAASVVGQDPNGLGNWIEIDKGSIDGIQEGMIVVVSKGILVGKVQHVALNTSQVTLLTNPESTINITTAANDTHGVARGQYGLGIIFDMIVQSDTVNVGDEVITSGIGGTTPPGLYVGTVQEVHPSSDHLFQQALIKSPLQVSMLEFVFVIKKSL